MQRENAVARHVVETAFRIHSRLGPGLFESVYESVMEHELARLGLAVRRQKPVPVVWDGVKLEDGFRVDLLVDERVIVEIKSVEHLADVHFKQVLTYLRLSGKRLGLLINFNVPLIRDGIRRVVNGLPDE
ncbi:MAG: GxxExxY protein [Armatimonadetes bacterium]|nr:GxxExxY protein [Armatimonadota bacterium]